MRFAGPTILRKSSPGRPGFGSGLDTGDICEQEVVAIDGKRPRDFYEQDIIPVAVRLLRYVILDLQAGIVRRRPQNQSAATCEPAFPRR